MDTNRKRKIVCVVQETEQELPAGTYTIHLDITAIPSLPSGDGDKTDFEWDVRVDGNSKRLPIEGEYDVILKRTRDGEIQDTMCIKIARPHAHLDAPDYEKSEVSMLNNGSAFKDAKANLGSLPDGTGFDPVEVRRKTTAADALTALVLSDAHYGFFGHGSKKTILFFDGVATASRIRAPKTKPLGAADIILPEAKGEMKDRLFRDVSFAILTGCKTGERGFPNLVRTFLDLGCDFVVGHKGLVEDSWGNVFLQYFYDLYKAKKDRSMQYIAIEAAEKADQELTNELSKDLRTEFAPGIDIKNNTPARYGDARR